MNALAQYPVADAHVDVLMRMDLENHSFHTSASLQAGLHQLESGNVKTQVFAIFVPPNLSPGDQLHSVLRQIDLYRTEIDGIAVHQVTSQSSLLNARRLDKIAGLLSVEGAACLHADVRVLHVLHTLGVSGIGLTWNGSNDLADGCREWRGAGLTKAGQSLIREMEQLSMWIDIAHLSDAGVFDVLNVSNKMIMASHANCRSIHHHPRNLTDETIHEVILRNGWIGITFEASFVCDGQPQIEDIFLHLDHVISLGGENHVGFGSDFDGTSNAIIGLQTASDYAGFSERIMDRYGESLGKRILFQNFEKFLMRQLPL